MSHLAQHSLETPAADLFTSAGILKSPSETPGHLALFVQQAEQALERGRGRRRDGAMAAENGSSFQSASGAACQVPPGAGGVAERAARCAAA